MTFKVIQGQGQGKEMTSFPLGTIFVVSIAISYRQEMKSSLMFQAVQYLWDITSVWYIFISFQFHTNFIRYRMEIV